MAAHNETGRAGEALAVCYFEKLGFNILHRNWRHANWEVDLIAERENMLHFIEVKTVSTAAYGFPEQRVTNKKIQYLINAAEEFLYLHPEWIRIQFDVLSIVLNCGKAEYFLIEDVYLI